MSEEWDKAYYNSVMAALASWNSNKSCSYGFQIQVAPESLIKACHLWKELLNNEAFPPDCGPFKRTGAFIVSCILLDLKFSTRDESGYNPTSDKAISRWKARILYLAAIFFLQQLELSDGTPLRKIWQPPTIHYKLDLLNFLIWAEIPTLQREEPPVLDVPRCNRLVMALALIYESCYYSTGNALACDVKDKVEPFAPDDEEILYDIIFDHELFIST